jgi:hypothetical protein
VSRIELTQSINRWICRAAPSLIIGALAIAVLSGCGAGGGDAASTNEFQIDVPTTPTTTAQPTTTGGKKDDSSNQNPYGGGGSGSGGVKPAGATPACTPATINAGVKAWANSKGTKASLISPNYKCADGWAIALVNVVPDANSYTSTLVFVGIDGKWVAQNRQEVCKSPSPVSNKLYQLGCNSN